MALSLGRRDVALVVDRAIEEFLAVVDELLDAVVVFDVLDDLVGGSEDVVERAGERFDDLLEERGGIFGGLVRIGVGSRCFGGLLDLVGAELGVLARDREKRVDCIRVLFVLLDRVDKLSFLRRSVCDRSTAWLICAPV